MNIILQLIVKIFQAIFEEDNAKRPTRTQPTQPVIRQGIHGEQDPNSVLADFFRELQGGSTTKPSPAQQTPNPLPRAQPPVETYEEHLHKQEAHLKELESRSHKLANHAQQHLGVDVSSEQAAEEKFQLPGNTPLQQIIYAGVILGPCKAKQPHARLL